MNSHRSFLAPSWLLLIGLGVGLATGGCKRGGDDDIPAGGGEAAVVEQSRQNTATSPSKRKPAAAPAAITPPVFELSADDLLQARLDDAEASDGWIRLFDGHTLFGWQMTGTANWSVEDQSLVVDAGDQGLLCTSIGWQDYELQLQYKADAKTNSGIFLRTPLVPEDPALDCYELNIAPPDNPFPTGSLVKRLRVEPEEVGEIDADQWHTFHVRVEGGTVTVDLDGKQVCQYVDPMPLGPGRIGLQHNEGRVAFRDVRLRPLGMESLLEGDDLSSWKRYPDMPGSFEINDQGHLQVTGGRNQLESRRQFADFVLLARCRTNAPDLNSGIFFRCIPGEQMNGYECQISNAVKDGNPLLPVDHGTGGFFRRQNARIVAAEDQQWFTMVLAARGRNMAAWVNGLQVSDWYDDRQPDPNPRQGLRLEPGTLMIQGHDPTTDLEFSDIRVAAIGKEPEPAWPVDGAADDEKPAEEKPAEEKPAEEKPADPADAATSG